jgi:Rod binding domain-containing protein
MTITPPAPGPVPAFAPAASGPPRSGPPQSGPPQSGPLWEKARALEAAFLSEMLAHAGQGATAGPLSGGAFSGGAGETQFASFLREELAARMVQSGGIGLAESIFRSMGGSDAARG